MAITRTQKDQTYQETYYTHVLSLKQTIDRQKYKYSNNCIFCLKTVRTIQAFLTQNMYNCELRNKGVVEI